MKTAYDNPNFARRIYKYKACPLNMTLFKRVLLPDWSVFEKVAVKIKKIGENGKTGKSNTQRMKKKGYIEDERAEKGFLDSNLTKDKTIANDGVIVIDSNSKTFDELLEGEFNTGMIDAKEAPEESNEGIDIIKHEVDEVDEADEANDLTKDKTIGNDGVIVIDSEMIPDESTNAEVNVNEGMEVAETREAEGNAFKDLLKRESNVSEQEDKPITDDMEILDQGGGGGGGKKG